MHYYTVVKLILQVPCNKKIYKVFAVMRRFWIILHNSGRYEKKHGKELFEKRAPSDYRVSSSAIMRPIRTPMTDAIISPRVQPLESPRQ